MMMKMMMMMMTDTLDGQPAWGWSPHPLVGSPHFLSLPALEADHSLAKCRHLMMMMMMVMVMVMARAEVRMPAAADAACCHQR